MLSAVLLMAALILAPIIGGGFGELTNGILQILVFGALLLLVLRKKDIIQHKLSMKWERVFFCLTLLSIFAMSEIGHWKTYSLPCITYIYFAALFFLWFIYNIICFRPRLPGKIALGIFLFISVVSAFVGESAYFGIKQMLFLSGCAGAYLLAAYIGKDKKMAAATVWGLMLSAMLICVFGIRDYAISSGGGAAFWKALFSSGDHMRLFGTFINPGFFSGFLVISIPVTLGVYLVTRARILTLVAGLALAVESIAMMLTGTKFGIVSAMATMIVFFALALSARCFGKLQIRRLAIIAVILLPLLIVFSKPLTSRVADAEEGGTQVHSATFRTFTWKATANMAKANPVLGVGTGTYDIAYPRYTIAGPTKYAHESYLQIAAESGIPALAAFIAAILAIAWRSLVKIWRDRKTPISSDTKASDSEITLEDLVPAGAWRLVNCAIFAALAGSAVRNVVDSDWYVIGIALPFWVIAGLLISPAEQTQESSASNKTTTSQWLVLASISIMAILSISFGISDYLSSADTRQADPQSMADRLATASSISPLNPVIHRELGKYLSVIPGERDKSISEFNIAMKLSPTLGANYYARALAAQIWSEPKDVIRYLRKSLQMNPNSTQAMILLADTYQGIGDTRNQEETLKRLLSVENTPYEQVKGTPELVDTTYAFAHAYFGDKYISQKKYALAAKEYEAVVTRLKRWKSNSDFLKVARFSGILTKDEEQRTLDLLQTSSDHLAEIQKSGTSAL